MQIKNCIHCNFCLTKQNPVKYCSFEDDAQMIFEKLERADIIVLATPVYFMRTSCMMATFLDRLRVFNYGMLPEESCGIKFDPSIRTNIMEDDAGLKSVGAILSRALELAGQIQK